MKILIAFLFVLVIVSAAVLIWGLTRGAVRSRIERQRHRDALAGAYMALSQIHTFSEDDYAKNLAKVALDDITTATGGTPRRSLTD